MVGCTKGFVSTLRETPRCSYTLLFALQGVSCQNFTSLLDDVSMENFVQTRPRKRIFASLCAEIGRNHKALLFYSEVLWLPCGWSKAKFRFQNMRYKIQGFLMLLKFDRPNLTGKIQGIKFRLCIQELRKSKQL